MKLRPALGAAWALVVMAGCQLPVTPWARFTAYPAPYYPQADFERRFNTWKGGKSGAWTIRYRATAHSDFALVLKSEGMSSFGPRFEGTGGNTTEFAPTRAELVKLVDDMMVTKVFDLYDGHYGAYDQGGGLVGPEIKVEIGGLLKHVSWDEDLSPSTSWEAGAVSRAGEAIKALGLKYINQKKAAASPSPSPSPRAGS